MPVDQMEKMLASCPEPTQNPDVLLTRLVIQAKNKIEEGLNQILNGHGITNTQFTTLMMLSVRPEQRIQPSELSHALHSSRTNATRIADQLQEKGWIQRHENADDRRSLYLQLTDKGQQFLRELVPQKSQYLTNVWSVLDQQEKKYLFCCIQKLLLSLENNQPDRSQSEEKQTTAALAAHGVLCADE